MHQIRLSMVSEVINGSAPASTPHPATPKLSVARLRLTGPSSTVSSPPRLLADRGSVAGAVSFRWGRKRRGRRWSYREERKKKEEEGVNVGGILPCVCCANCATARKEAISLVVSIRCRARPCCVDGQQRDVHRHNAAVCLDVELLLKAEAPYTKCDLR